MSKDIKINKVYIIEIHRTKYLVYLTGFNRIGFYNTESGFLINLFFISFLLKKEMR